MLSVSAAAFTTTAQASSDDYSAFSNASPAIISTVSTQTSLPIHHQIAQLLNGTLCAIFYTADASGGNSFPSTSVSNNNGATWSRPTQISTQYPSTLGSAIAADGNNNIYAAWVSYGPGDTWPQLYSSKYNGLTWSTPIRISSSSEPDLYVCSVDICVDKNNKVTLVWDTCMNGNENHDFQRNRIFCSTYNSTAWSSPTLISAHNDTTPYFQLNPAVAVDSNNNIHVVWEASGSPSTDGTLWYAKYDGAWHSPVKLAQSTIPSMYGMYLQRPAIAVDSNNVLHVVWEAPSSMETRTNQIWYLSYTNSPSTATVISAVPQSDTSDQESPAIAVDTQNRVHVLWNSARENVLFYSRLASNWSIPIQVEGPNAGYAGIANFAPTQLNYVFLQDSTLMFNSLSTGTLPSGPSLSVKVNPPSEVVSIGQSLKLTAAVSAGASPYSYQWYLDGQAVSGANADSWMFTPQAAAAYNVSVSVTDGANQVANGSAQVKATSAFVKGSFGYLDSANGGQGVNAYTAFGSRYTLNVDANLTSMSGYVSTWSGPNYAATYSYRFAVYADNNGSVGSLIAQTETATLPSSGYGRWSTAYFSSPIHLAPGTYWLMGVMDAANGGSIYGPQTNDYNRSINFQTSGLTFPSSIPNAQPWLGHLYCLYASWSINCSVPVRDDPDLFALSSNSTVSSLLYNSTSKQLSFTVSGASGTHGYADIYLSTNLAPSLSGLTVYLDGAQLTFNSSSVGNYWILHFVYTHSTHTVTVNLPDQSQSTPTSIPTATPTYSPPSPSTPTPTDTSTPTIHTLSPTPAATGTVPEYPHTLLFTVAILLAVAVLAVPLIYYKRGKAKGIHDLT